MSTVGVNVGAIKVPALLFVLLCGQPHFYFVHVSLHHWNMHSALLLLRPGNVEEQQSEKEKSPGSSNLLELASLSS